MGCLYMFVEGAQIASLRTSDCDKTTSIVYGGAGLNLVPSDP